LPQFSLPRFGQLAPYRNNARTHSKKQIRQIADSIRCFGFTNPVLMDDSGQIIAGHGRVEAAKLLGLVAVPAIRISHLSGAQKKAYVLADNRLAEKGGWDKEILAIELQALIDLNFEVELTGFEAPHIDMVLDDAAEASGGATGSRRRHPGSARHGRRRISDRRCLGPWPSPSALRQCT
jgi:ParB-like nuclease domain